MKLKEFINDLSHEFVGMVVLVVVGTPNCEDDDEDEAIGFDSVVLENENGHLLFNTNKKSNEPLTCGDLWAYIRQNNLSLDKEIFVVYNNKKFGVWFTEEGFDIFESTIGTDADMFKVWA